MERQLKNLFKRKVSVDDERITNDKVSEVRADVIKKGRKFKYPVQYEKYKIVTNVIIIGIVVLLGISFAVWWSLYRTNGDSLVLFKITQTVPLAAGEIDSQLIRYSDYLAQYRSAVHYQASQQELSLHTQESLDKLHQEYRQQAFLNAARIALAEKIAKENNLDISKEEIQADLEQKLSYDGSKLSLEAFDVVMQKYYGLSRQEYQQTFIRNPLLVRKVAFEIDQSARQLAEELGSELATDGSNFKAVAEAFGDRVVFTDLSGIKHSSSDNGRAVSALSLATGQVSDIVKSINNEGYYFVKLLAKDDSYLHYQSILVPLTEFSKRFDQLLEGGLIKPYLNFELRRTEF